MKRDPHVFDLVLFLHPKKCCGCEKFALERGGVRLPRQAEDGGTFHRHTVSGPRGCRALPLHFQRCSLGALRRIGAAMASGGGKRLSGAVCGCGGKRRLGAHPTDTL